MLSRLYPRLIAFLMLCFATSQAQAIYLFSAPPREPAAKGVAMYQPIANLLSKVLGEPVKYQHPGNWAQYARDMQNGNYDFVFDGPHFTAWRIAHIEHTPLVSLGGKLRFFVFAHDGDGEINSMDDLKFDKVCAIASPNLTAVMVLAQFDGVASPRIVPAKGGMKGVFKRFLDGDCRATVLRDNFVAKLNEGQAGTLKPLFESPAYPNQGISVGSRVPQAMHTKLIEALTSEDGKQAASALIKRFGDSEAPHFEAADLGEYEGHNRLLEGVVWGW